jgi:hypothetical protein
MYRGYIGTCCILVVSFRGRIPYSLVTFGGIRSAIVRFIDDSLNLIHLMDCMNCLSVSDYARFLTDIWLYNLI